MNVKSEYKRLRNKNWTVKSALHAARVNVAFEKAEAQGKVKFECVPDECAHFDDLFGETEGMAEEDIAKQREEFLRRIEIHGVWGLVSSYRVVCKHCKSDRWEHADSCWGFLGDDLQDNGTDTDVKESALAKIGVKIP